MTRTDITPTRAPHPTDTIDAVVSNGAPSDRAASDDAAARHDALAALDAIDTAPLDELNAIRRDQTRIHGFRERAASMRTEVEPHVYERVAADYTARIAALDARAAPLLERAAHEYRVLQRLRGGLESTITSAQLAREELRFRHAVGELDEGELAERAREPEDTLSRGSAELAALDALKARFIEAAGSEEALATPAGSAESAEPPESSQTNIFLTTDAPDAGSMSPDTSPSTSPDISPNTVVGSSALLIEASESDGVREGAGARHHLGLTTTVGRSDENSLVLDNPGVSRLHAILEATATGYMLRDLHSQNGTFVNGARVDSQALRDGDEVVFGDACYIFRAFDAGAPAPHPQQGADRGRHDS